MDVKYFCVILISLIPYIQGRPQLLQDWDEPSTVELDAIKDASLEDIPVLGSYEMDGLVRRSYLDTRRHALALLKWHGRRNQEKVFDRAEDDDDLAYELEDFSSGLKFDFTKGITGL